MSIVQSIRDAGPCRKQVTIEVPAEEVQAERMRMLREYGRTVSVPGFRKGKVPPSVLRQRFGARIDQEVVEGLVPQYWQQAREESGIEPLLPPELQDVGELADGEPLTFVATVEIRPEIEIGDLDGFELPDPPVEPSEDEIRDALDGLRRQVAEWKQVEREAARGDLVTVEITELRDAGEETEPKTDTLDIEVGDPRVWEELSLAVTGLAAGQEGRFSHRDPQPAEQTGPPPAERHFRVAVTAVKERDLPPLDDELAKMSGDFESLDELRAKVRERLAEQKRSDRAGARREALLEQLRNRHPLTLPAGVVDREVESLVQDYAENLARRGVDLEKAALDWGQVREEARPQAEKQVHTRLLLEAIAEKESITAEAADVEEALAVFAQAQGTSVPVLRRVLEQSDRLAGFREQVRRNKTVRHLLGEEGEAPEEPAADAAP